MLQREGHELIIISARGRNFPEMKKIALERFKKEDLRFDKYYWSQDDKLETVKNENKK